MAHCVHGLGLGGAQQVIKHIVAGADPTTFRFFVYAAEDGMFRDQLEDAGATVRILPRWIPRFDPLSTSAARTAKPFPSVTRAHR